MATVKQIKEDPYGKYLTKLAKVESGNNPNAKANTSSASGLYQFTESTWKGLTDKYKLNYSLDDRFDPVKSKKMAEILTKENENVLKNVLGRELNDGERYLGHFLGSQDSKNLLSSYTKNPNQKVSEVIGGGALSANKSIFYNKDGSEKTVKDVYNWALKKMDINVDDQESTNYSESEYNPITTDVNNFFGSKKIPTLAGVPDMPQEEEKQKKEDKDVAELKQQTREQEFLREVQESYAQQPIQQEQPQPRQQTVAPITNYIQTFEEVSNFIQNPIVAQQGVQKKPIYVDSKNDPRYRAYQDSLSLYNKAKIKEDKFKQYSKIDDLKIVKQISNDFLPTTHPKIAPTSRLGYLWDNKKGYVQVNKGYTNKAITDNAQEFLKSNNYTRGFAEEYKKPTQPVIYQKPQIRDEQPTKQITPAGIQTQAQLPQADGMPERNYAKIPTSYNVSSQRYNMAGENPYYNFNAENTDYETALRAKMAAEAFNADIQRRYGNEEALKNPKAVERLNQLRQEVNITPNYQQGGERNSLWKNIRENRGSGKEPTKEMLEQEQFQEQSMQEFQNGGYYQEGAIVPKKRFSYMRDNQIDNQTQKDNYNSDKYAKAWKTGNVQNKSANGETEPYWGGELDEIEIKNNYKKGFWEQSRDKYLEENRDTGLFGAIGSVVTYPLAVAQDAMMYGLTDKVQKPSQAWSSDEATYSGVNPFSYMPKGLKDFTTDVVLDPTNLVGAGLYAKAKNLSKARFVNNLANPLAGTGDLVNNLGNKVDNIANQLPEPESFIHLDVNSPQSINLNRTERTGKNIYKETLEEGNLKINKRGGTPENPKTITIKTKTGAIQATQNPDGSYMFHNAVDSRIDAGKAMLKLNEHFPKKPTIFETSSMSTDSYTNLLKIGKSKDWKSSFEGFSPLNDSNKNVNFLDDLLKWKNRGANAAFASEKNAIEAQRRMNAYLNKQGYDESAKIFQKHGEWQMEVPNYRVQRNYQQGGYIPTGASYLATQGENKQQGGTKTSNMLRVVSNMLNRGSSPKQILRSLVRMSVPRDVAQQLVQRASKPIKYNQQGGEYTENEIAFLSEIAIKDNQGYWNPNNQGKVVEIEGNQITMKGVDKDLLGISKQTGETKIMKPNKDYKFGKGTKNVIEVPLKK